MFWRKETEVENQKKLLPRLAKVHVLNGVWVCMCGGAEEGVAGSPEGFLLWRLLHVVPRTQFSLSNGEELKAPGPRVVQIHSLQGIPPVQFLNIILEPIKHASFP